MNIRKLEVIRQVYRRAFLDQSHTFKLKDRLQRISQLNGKNAEGTTVFFVRAFKTGCGGGVYYEIIKETENKDIPHINCLS